MTSQNCNFQESRTTRSGSYYNIYYSEQACSKIDWPGYPAYFELKSSFLFLNYKLPRLEIALEGELVTQGLGAGTKGAFLRVPPVLLQSRELLAACSNT